MANISQDDLTEINELRMKLSSAVSIAGQATLQIQLLKQDISALEQRIQDASREFNELLEKEEMLVKRLSETYGVGSIDFETGEITPET
jgi:chromosome segregation ATPase